MTFRYLREHPDNPHRLGRHRIHDALTPDREVTPRTLARRPLASVDHQRVCAPFDQDHCNPAVISELGGDPSVTALGNCTANAALGCLMTAPFHRAGWAFTEDDAVRLYHEETQLDDTQIPGEWPNDDTGSSGPWAMTALEKRGLIAGWRHTRSLHTALRLLAAGPIAVGSAWFQSMFEPDRDGVVTVDERSGLAGGHEYELTRLDVENQMVWGPNSWGTGWGRDGYFGMSWTDLDVLLGEGGDVVQPILH
jgi:hypothetical protein